MRLRSELWVKGLCAVEAVEVPSEVWGALQTSVLGGRCLWSMGILEGGGPEQAPARGGVGAQGWQSRCSPAPGLRVGSGGHALAWAASRTLALALPSLHAGLPSWWR